MSAFRKFVVSIAALFVTVAAMSTATTGTASADCPWGSPVPCFAAPQA